LHIAGKVTEKGLGETQLICESSERLATEPWLQFELWACLFLPSVDSSIVDFSECAEIGANVLAAQWRTSGLRLFWV
jgi:hypothetical protein